MILDACFFCLNYSFWSPILIISTANRPLRTEDYLSETAAQTFRVRIVYATTAAQTFRLQIVGATTAAQTF